MNIFQINILRNQYINDPTEKNLDALAQASIEFTLKNKIIYDFWNDLKLLHS